MYKSVVTLTLDEAAKFLNMSNEALRLKAKQGKIPGAKLGKRWVFLEDDLVLKIRKEYHHGLEEKKVLPCLPIKNSTNAEKRGGTDLHIQELMSKFAQAQKHTTGVRHNAP